MTPFTFRQLFAAGLLGCLACMAFVVLYIQHYLGLEPCPLCVAQRVAMIATALGFLAGAVHAPRGNGRWFYGGLTALMAAAGAGIAGRHVWLQGLPPDQIPACGPTLEYLMEMLPFTEVVRTLLRGDNKRRKGHQNRYKAPPTHIANFHIEHRNCKQPEPNCQSSCFAALSSLDFPFKTWQNNRVLYRLPNGKNGPRKFPKRIE